MKSSGGALEPTAGRRAVIILNDDRDAAGRGNNEFIFGDFNEDELKLFDDNEEEEEEQEQEPEEDEKDKEKEKSLSSSNKQQQTETQTEPEVDSNEVELEAEEQDDPEEEEQEQEEDRQPRAEKHRPNEEQLNDSGTASDVVNSSASLDMLSISAEAAQSPSNAAATASSSSAVSLINSSTPSASASNSSSSVSISSTASGSAASSSSASSSSSGNVGACLASVSGMLANQSADSGIYAAANTSVKEHVNHFLSKASSSEEMLPSNVAAISMQQLETCNDIEAAIIAAARAAAAARSTSCSRSNSQESKPVHHQERIKNPSGKAAVYMAYNDGDEEEDEECLQELSFMADMRADPATPTPPEGVTVLPPPTSQQPSSTRPVMMTNTELIVDYIANSE